MQTADLAPLIRGFFEQHLGAQRGLSGNTVLAYRDAIKLLLLFAGRHLHKAGTDLTLEDVSADIVRLFLRHLEEDRHNSIPTRNLRLAAIHCFYRYLATFDSRYMTQCQSILAVPFKRRPHRTAQYLERDEVQAIFKPIDCRTPLGQRDDALLRMLYNGGMRAQEVVDLNVNHVRFTRPYSVRIVGKGNRERVCPLWRETITAVRHYLASRSVEFTAAVPLFINVYGDRLTRFGIRYIVAHRVSEAAKTNPPLLTRRVTPHTWRHTTAMHLLQSNVDLTMIRSWLGHASIETTNGYVEIDLQMKQKTLESCKDLLPKAATAAAKWKQNKDVLAWLSSL
jgi:site-specific recombinase XerD